MSRHMSGINMRVLYRLTIHYESFYWSPRIRMCSAPRILRQCPWRRGYPQLCGGERQHLTAVSVQCFPSLLRLEVSIAQGCPQIAMIEYIADQVQRHARLCKPGTDRAPDVVDPNVLQARARQNA